MAIIRVSVIFVLVSTFGGLIAFTVNEPMCTSRFDYEEKLLSKLLRIEHAMELLQERVSNELSAIKEEKIKMDKDFLSFKESFITEQAVVKENLEKLSEEIEKENFKLVEDFKTMSQQYESKIQRISEDLADAFNKSSSNHKSVFAVQKATGNLVDGVPTFSTVHTNVGNAYDVSTGKFKCIKDGLHLFTFGIRSVTSNYVYCYIRMNKTNINYAISDGSYDMASVTVYLDLKTGDVIDVGSCGNWVGSNFHPESAYFLGMDI